MASQAALRRLNGQMAVLRLQVHSASHLLSEVRDGLSEMSELMVGEERRAVDKLDRLCQDWQCNHDRIQVTDEDPE